MRPEDLKLFELIQSDEAAGTLFLKNRRVLLVDADALGVLRRELITSLGVREARRILARFGYAYGYRSALTVRQWFAGDGEDDWWRLGLKLRSLDGSVSVRPLRLEVDLERGVFEAESEWVNSYEAEQHLSHIGVSPIPVCWTLVGYASGYASAVLGREVYFVETECVGRGDARCLAYGSTNIEPGSEAARRALEYSDFSDEEFAALDEDLFQKQVEALKLIAAREDCVIVGYGGAFVLPHHGRMVNLYFHAPLKFRMRRLMEIYDLPGTHEARQMIEESDEMRKRYFARMTDMDWTCADNYHLCIDTSIYPLPELAERLIRFVERKLGITEGTNPAQKSG